MVGGGAMRRNCLRVQTAQVGTCPVAWAGVSEWEALQAAGGGLEVQGGGCGSSLSEVS